MATSDKEQSDNGKSAGGRPFEVYYVKDQVLITGPDEQGIPEGETRIERVVDAVNKRFDVRLVPAKGGEMSPLQLQWDLAEEDWECLKGLEVIPSELLECLQLPLVMRPYDIVDVSGEDRQGLVEKVSRFINVKPEEADDLDPCVRIEPNWVIGYQYSVAGSPFGIPETAVQADEFWEQWALKRIGLIQNGMRATRRCGQGVRVGVFDTSPFKVEGCPMPAVPGHPPLLTVVHPEVFRQFPELPPPSLPNLPDPPDLNSHGLSVAGLVYAVAPHSDIYLYRVLDRHARGNLYVLCCALMEFMEGVLSNPDDAPNGGIINLSLGVPMPAKGRKERIGTESVFALDSVLTLAHCLGLTVVAAAGNESTRQGPPKSTGFPASQPYAIGVKASNYCNERSCFSNKGDVSAPGGDGYDCGEGMGGDCACPWDKVTGAERRKYGLVGPVLPDEKFPYGFARWLGTSFATPLVSGLAALVREHHGGPFPSVVSSEILGHVNEGVEEIEGCDEIKGGIINLPDYL